MKTVCDTGLALCPHKPQCDHLCHFTDAKLLYVAPEPDPSAVIRKIKPYPVIPDDIEPVSDTWQMIGSVVVGFVLVALVVIAALFFFTGFYIWSLLI
jgi:hypothetical protein